MPGAGIVVAELGEHTTEYMKVTNVAATKLSGQLISFPAGTTGNTSGVALLKKDASSGEAGVPAIIGGCIVRYTAVSADTGTIGDLVYFDNGNDRLTTTSTSNNIAGRFAKVKANGETTAEFILNGGGLV